jgi:hypothetical protein
MKEKEIQEKIESLLETNKLIESIKNINEIRELYEKIISEDRIPSLSIDYLSREKAILASKNVIDNLFTTKIISKSTNDISLKKNGSMYPDVVVFNPETEKIIIVELKRSKSTARETITELMAYEHGIKNYLPFLSNFDVLYCVVSTDYTTLLDFSISSLTVWESKQILALEIVKEGLIGKEPELTFKIHLPNAWSSLGFLGKANNSLSTSKITLQKKKDFKFKEEAREIIFHAAELISKEGDRNKSHGFALVGQDLWCFPNAVNFQIICGFINPYAFLPITQDTSLTNHSRKQIGRYFIDNQDDIGSSYLCSAALRKALDFLWQFFFVDLEGLSDWSTDRLLGWELEDGWDSLFSGYETYLGFRHRILPLKVETWGCLGDFSRDYVSHPGTRKYILSGYAGKVYNCTDPLISIPVIDQFSGISLLEKEGFSCKTFFKLGAKLASIGTLYNTGITAESNNLRQLPASISWYFADIQKVLIELNIQYQISDTLHTPPPTLIFCVQHDFDKGLKSLKKLIEWISECFLAEDKYKVHSNCFYLGQVSHGLLDEYFSDCFPPNERREVESEIVKISKNILRAFIEICFSSLIDPKARTKILDHMIDFYLDVSYKSSVEKSLVYRNAIENLPDTKRAHLAVGGVEYRRIWNLRK